MGDSVASRGLGRYGAFTPRAGPMTPSRAGQQDPGGSTPGRGADRRGVFTVLKAAPFDGTAMPLGGAAVV